MSEILHACSMCGVWKLMSKNRRRRSSGDGTVVGAQVMERRQREASVVERQGREAQVIH